MQKSQGNVVDFCLKTHEIANLFGGVLLYDLEHLHTRKRICFDGVLQLSRHLCEATTMHTTLSRDNVDPRTRNLATQLASGIRLFRRARQVHLLDAAVIEGVVVLLGLVWGLLACDLR